MDQWHHDFIGAPSDGSAWDDGSGGNRALRGASMFNSVRYLRVSLRRGCPAIASNRGFGFRIAQNL